ncbi:MAG: UbiA family prenyltransferase, partial [Acidobacteria bacterium]|nr:UbiA family prenyltransferase [Acidobacteriota bacterium]
MNSFTETLKPPLASESAGMADYLELTKPRVTSLILMSTLVGFYMASTPPFPFLLLLHALIGTALVASGTAALNQFWEREADSKMLRTRNRPLPAGRMRPWKALWFGILLSLVGIFYLAWLTNFLTSLLAALTLGSYLFLYT